MANVSIVKSMGNWKGTIEVDRVATDTSFEVFDSQDNWEFLSGKTLLHTFKTIHNYNNDTIEIKGTGGTTMLKNQFNLIQTHQQPKEAENPTIPICIISEDVNSTEQDALSEINTERSGN